MEMVERARQIKEYKYLQEEILSIFRKQCLHATFDSLATVEHFEITKSIYEGLQGSCQSWLREKIQTSKKMVEFLGTATLANIKKGREAIFSKCISLASHKCWTRPFGCRVLV